MNKKTIVYLSEINHVSKLLDDGDIREAQKVLGRLYHRKESRTEAKEFEKVIEA